MSNGESKLVSSKVKQLLDIYHSKFDLPIEVVDIKGVPVMLGGGSPPRQPLCCLLEKTPAACARCHEDHQKAIQWAFGVGESYTFICHAGLLVTCTPLADGTRRLGALLSGKTLPEGTSKELVAEIHHRLRPFGVDEGAIWEAIRAHKTVPGSVLQKAADLLFRLSGEILELDGQLLREQREQAQQQSQIADTIHAVKKSTKQGLVPYPYEREKDLLERVKLGDRYGAKGVLNEILGIVLFRNPMGSSVLKTRLIELLAILSRAAAEAGVDVEKVLGRNLVYFSDILNCDNDSDLCVFITKALNEFLDTVCIERDAQTETPLAAVVQFIELNYSRDLTVEELAQQAHLSPSRLAHLFQENMGTTMTEIVTRVRIERAKKLLLETNLSCTEISFHVGYNDQSYFTRVFRDREKITPRQFRVLTQNPMPLRKQPAARRAPAQ
jgi:two-component system, response regulator YesN